MPTITLEELARQLNAEFTGDPNTLVERVSHPTQANNPSDLALVLDKGILPLLEIKPIQTALVPQDLEISSIPNQLKVERPKVALAKLLEIFDKPAYVPPGIHPSATVDPTATLGEGVQIGPLCSVGPNATIGKNTRLVSHVSIGEDTVVGESCLFYPGAMVGDRVQIGNRVILQPNAAIGGDGFSFVTPQKGSVESARTSGKVEAQNTAILRINSIGIVVLEDDVEIGANSCVDRATLGETRIKRGTKIDNLVQVGHNVTIGENCLFAGQVGIAGSTVVGDRVVMGGQVGVGDHLKIGNDAIIAPMTGVASDVAEKTILMGFHGQPRREFLYREMQIKRLQGLPKRVQELTERLDALETQKQNAGQPV